MFACVFEAVSSPNPMWIMAQNNRKTKQTTKSKLQSFHFMLIEET